MCQFLIFTYPFPVYNSFHFHCTEIYYTGAGEMIRQLGTLVCRGVSISLIHIYLYVRIYPFPVDNNFRLRCTELYQNGEAQLHSLVGCNHLLLLCILSTLRTNLSRTFWVIFGHFWAQSTFFTFRSVKDEDWSYAGCGSESYLYCVNFEVASKRWRGSCHCYIWFKLDDCFSKTNYDNDKIYIFYNSFVTEKNFNCFKFKI